MSTSRLSISPAALEESEDRFQRFKLIGWWDQQRLSQAKVLVIGAGALGNEIIKNLALVGIGNLLVADLDTIENSNLSRSVLYRAADNGQPKAEIAARAAQSIYPEMRVRAWRGNVVHDLGLGVFRWADIILGGLDNREARLAINRFCWKVNRPWVDGAIEQIQGCARFFAPDGPCYECTMSDTDWKILQQRKSCNLLSKQEMEGGRTPTTPTISSIIAGVQCQEAVKHLHGLPTMSGRGWVFEGLSGDSYSVEYQRKEDCYSHDTLDEIISLEARAGELTVGVLLARARQVLGPAAVLEFPRDLIERLVCPQCRGEEPVFSSVSKVDISRVWCPVCPQVRREVVTFYRVTGEESFLARTLAEIGVPAFDIVSARAGERAVGFELASDAPLVLGGLIAGEEEVERA
jgi:adenylyltransferase/sulfurtransferase